jgi:hypothetical protein
VADVRRSAHHQAENSNRDREGGRLMAGQGNGTVIVPWYATGFRAEGFGAALEQAAAIALRYGAESYAVYRSRDDRYRYQQLAHFERYSDWERYWEGPEMVDFRASHSSWYQIPVLYGWWDLTAAGKISAETEWVLPEPPEPDPDGNGKNGMPAHPAARPGNGSGAPRVRAV